MSAYMSAFFTSMHDELTSMQYDVPSFIDIWSFYKDQIIHQEGWLVPSFGTHEVWFF